jgi:hypothetical protein
MRKKELKLDRTTCILLAIGIWGIVTMLVGIVVEVKWIWSLF